MKINEKIDKYICEKSKISDKELKEKMKKIMKKNSHFDKSDFIRFNQDYDLNQLVRVLLEILEEN